MQKWLLGSAFLFEPIRHQEPFLADVIFPLWVPILDRTSKDDCGGDYLRSTKMHLLSG